MELNIYLESDKHFLMYPPDATRLLSLVPKIMISQLVQIEVDLYDSLPQLEQAIEDKLKQQGEPLRWVVLEVDQERQKVYVEAIVLISS